MVSWGTLNRLLLEYVTNPLYVKICTVASWKVCLIDDRMLTLVHNTCRPFTENVSAQHKQQKHSTILMYWCTGLTSRTCLSLWWLLSQSPDTNCDLDHIPTSLLKQCSHILLPTITNIINLSIYAGIFPDQFKNCSVHPHFNKNQTWIKMIMVIIVLYHTSHSYQNWLKE